jgi:uncharacterized protein
MTQNYVLPFVAYLFGATAIGVFGDGNYPIAYSGLVIVVGIVTWSMLWREQPVKPSWNIWEGIVFGLVGIAAWIYLSHLHLESYLTQFFPKFLRPGARASYNPFEELSQPWMVYSFIVFRMIGLAVLVPIIEEVFWRGFLARWLIAEDWKAIPLGFFTLSSFFSIVGLFTLAHPEWLAAALYAILANLLLLWKKDLWPCIVMHSVSNFALGVYVLVYGAWALW